jgi:hypothetical protein
MHLRCPECGLLYARSDGFFLGAMVINYGVVVFVLLPLVLLVVLMDWLGVPVAVVLALVMAVALPLALYRWSWAMWLALYYCVLPHELPVNETERIPVREDE